MSIKNLTKGLVIDLPVEWADTFLKRATGLMFKKKYDGAMIFPIKGEAHFHGFFCFFPILLVCVKDRKVVCKKILHPWHVEKVRGDYVIEFDARRDIPLDVGDEVEIVEART